MGLLLGWVRGPGERDLKRAFGAWIRRVLLANRFPGVVLGREAELGWTTSKQRNASDFGTMPKPHCPATPSKDGNERCPNGRISEDFVSA